METIIIQYYRGNNIIQEKKAVQFIANYNKSCFNTIKKIEYGIQ